MTFRAQLESAIIELLEAESYPPVLGGAVERQPHEVHIQADFRAFHPNGFLPNET